MVTQDFSSMFTSSSRSTACLANSGSVLISCRMSGYSKDCTQTSLGDTPACLYSSITFCTYIFCVNVPFRGRGTSGFLISGTNLRPRERMLLLPQQCSTAVTHSSARWCQCAWQCSELLLRQALRNTLVRTAVLTARSLRESKSSSKQVIDTANVHWPVQRGESLTAQCSPCGS
jgi:hypothetical protein